MSAAPRIDGIFVEKACSKINSTMGNESIQSWNCFKQLTKKGQNYNGDKSLVFVDEKFPAFLTTRLPANEYNIWHTCLVKLALKARIFSYIFNRLGATSNSLQRKDRTTTSDKLIVFVNEEISCALQYVIYTETSTSKIVIKRNLLLSWICCNET